jgi:membrane fusion protein (multidrug efflux system)
VDAAAALCVALSFAAACTRVPREREAQATPAPPLPPDVAALAPVASPSATSPATPGPPAAAERGLQLTGELAAPVRSELVARTTGRVARVFVDEGQPVRKGQTLLALETEYLELEAQRADAEAARAEAAARDAERDFERKAGLLARGSVPQAVHDRSQAAAEQARAGLAAARAAAALARRRVADAVLTSPIDGVVGERRADVGEHLGDGSVAFVLLQTAPLKLRFHVPERYLAAVHRGQPVSAFVDPYPGQAFAGRVTLVGGSVDSATRTFLVEAEFANRDGRLRPGLFARVELALGTPPSARSGGDRAQAR